MIRPVTCVCVLLAGASGLYLYQTKHRVQLLDRQIEATVRAAQAARERTGVLRAEWTLRSDPERLAQLASRFLQLKTVTPGQFTTLADLGNRLPPVAIPDPQGPETEPAEPAQDVIAMAPDAAPADPAPVQAAGVQAAAAPKPETPKPAPVKAVAVAKSDRVPERVAEHPVEQHPLEHPAERSGDRRPAQLALASPPARVPTRSVIRPASVLEPVPAPVRLTRPIAVSYAQPGRLARAVPVAPAVAVGSSLGIARTSSLPPPVPVPAYNPPNGN